MIKVVYKRPWQGWKFSFPAQGVAEIGAKWLRRSRG